MDGGATNASLLVRVRSRLCAFPLEHVLETMRALPVDSVAGTPSCVRGLALVRGAPVPVLDVARLFGDGETDDRLEGSGRFVIASVAERRVALLVDGVMGVRSLPLRAFEELPPLLRDLRPDVIERVGALDAELLVVLRSARLLAPGLLEGIDARAPS